MLEWKGKVAIKKCDKAASIKDFTHKYFPSVNNMSSDRKQEGGGEDEKVNRSVREGVGLEKVVEGGRVVSRGKG